MSVVGERKIMNPKILDGSGLTAQMNCRITGDEYSIVLKQCETEQMSLSELLRAALSQYLQQKQRTPQ